MKAVRAIAPALALLLPVSACAQVYKWVDEKGQTHYSEKPPANLRSKELKLREASPRSEGAGPAPSSSLKEQEAAFRERQVKREQEAAKTAKDDAERERRCKNARFELADLQGQRRIVTRDDKGERVFMPDNEREALTAKRQAEVSQYCR